MIQETDSRLLLWRLVLGFLVVASKIQIICSVVGKHLLIYFTRLNKGEISHEKSKFLVLMTPSFINIVNTVNFCL